MNFYVPPKTLCCQRPSLRSTETPSGLPPRSAYYDGSGSVGGGGGGSAGGSAGGGNAFRNSGFGGGSAGGAGGYGQTPTVQPSPFARGTTPTNALFSAPTGGLGGAPGSAYGVSARYRQVSPATGPRPTTTAHQQGFSPDVGYGSEVALVPVEANGDGRGRSVMDDDDDDVIPTRSLADEPDGRDNGTSAVEGLRCRRGGGGGGGGGILGGGFSAERPDTQRATWIVVWGVPPGTADDVLTRFLQFGHVEEQRGQPGSNWLYLK